MTRSRIELPQTPSTMKETMNPLGFVLDENSRSYKIFGYCFARKRDPYYLTMCEHISELGSSPWDIIGDWDCNDEMTIHLPTFHRGALHCLTTEEPLRFPFEPREERIQRVFRYEGGRSWHQLTAGQIPLDLLFERMFEWQGNLMLLGGNGIRDVVSSVKVWQLDLEKNIWVESTTVPDYLLHCLSPCPKDISVHSSAGYIYLGSRLTRSCPDRTRPRFVLVMCNLLKKLWWEAPGPELSSNCDISHGYGFLFKPGFDTV